LKHHGEHADVNDSVQGYENLFPGAAARNKIMSNESRLSHKEEESIQQRKREYASMINNFYNLVTDFYEFGWGQVSSKMLENKELWILSCLL
jgi:hypothetical protein